MNPMRATPISHDAGSAGLGHILAPGSTFEIIADDLRFGEGPVWHRREATFYWVDIVGDTIWRWSAARGRELVMRPSGKANGLTLDAEGRLVAAGWARRSIWRLEEDGSISTLSTHYEGKRINSPNDLVVKSDGAIYFTDPSGALNNVGMGGDDLQRYLDFHGVYRLEPSGELRLVVRDFVYPNGLAFSPDESLLYVNDTRAMLIRVFKVREDGLLDAGRVFAKVDGDGPGRPDGMKVDVEGNVYCTGPSGVHIFSPDGRWLGRIKVPGHITNFSFGGDDSRDLFVVTQTSVLRTRLGIPGLPVGPRD